jgi:hypothetical protein
MRTLEPDGVGAELHVRAWLRLREVVILPGFVDTSDRTKVR